MFGNISCISYSYIRGQIKILMMMMMMMMMIMTVSVHKQEGKRQGRNYI